MTVLRYAAVWTYFSELTYKWAQKFLLCEVKLTLMEQEENTFYVPALLPIPIKILSQWLKHGLDSEVDLRYKHKLFYNDIQARMERRDRRPHREMSVHSAALQPEVDNHMLKCCFHVRRGIGRQAVRPHCEIRNLQYGCLLWTMSLLTRSFSRWGWISALWNVFRGEFRFPLRTQTLSDLLFTPSLWLGCFFCCCHSCLFCFVFWWSFPKIWKSWNHLAPGSTQHPASTFGVQLSNSWIFSPMFRPQAGKEFNVLQGLLFHRK